jgi:hypothetical protein
MLLSIGCSYEDNFLNFSTNQETSIPRKISLNEGEAFYFENCDIEIKLITVTGDYLYDGNDIASIQVNFNYGNSYTLIEYYSINGIQSYYAENATNYVFNFEGIHWVDDHFELDISVKQYATL